MLIFTSLCLVLLLCLLCLAMKGWIGRRRERERASLTFSEAVLAVVREKFNTARSSECIHSGASGILTGIPHEREENQYSSVAPIESDIVDSPYAKLLAMMAWLWFLAALPFVTDAACQIFVAGILALTWMILALAWLCGLLAPSYLLRSSSSRKWWLSAGLAGILGLLLAFTDLGFILRVALSEPALNAYVIAVPPGTKNANHSERRVGLFLVDGTQESNGTVVLYTSMDFLDRHGIAYVPDGAIPPGHLSVNHLFGPWYRIRWHF